MATWSLKINVIDVTKKRVSISATRTDGEDIKTYNILDAIVATPAQQIAVIEQFQSMRLADITKQTAVDAIVNDLETAGETAMNTWEAQL